MPWVANAGGQHNSTIDGNWIPPIPTRMTDRVSSYELATKDINVELIIDIPESSRTLIALSLDK